MQTVIFLFDMILTFLLTKVVWRFQRKLSYAQTLGHMAGDNGRFIPFKIRCAVTSMTIEVRTRPIISKPMVQDYILPTVVHLIMFQRHMYRRVCRVAGINKGKCEQLRIFYYQSG